MADQFLPSLAAIAALLVLLGAQKAWRAYSTGKVLTQGLLVEAEVVKSRMTIRFTMVKFRYIPEGCESPIVVKRYLENTHVEFQPGQRLAVRYMQTRPRTCVLVAYAGHHGVF